jgi:hypothetical protein
MAGNLNTVESVFDEFTSEEFDLVPERRIAVENDKVFFLQPAPAALSAVADFPMKFFRAHLYAEFGGKFAKLL